MNKLFLAFSLFITLTSCSSKYKINGESSLPRLDGKKVFLKALRNGEMVAIDSAEVVHGLFSMKGKIDSVEMVMLYMDDFSIMPLVLERGHIRIQLNNTELLAKGTVLNEKLYSFFKQKTSLDDRMDDLERKEAKLIMNGGNLEEIRNNLIKENEKLTQEMIALVKNFICENYENVLGPGVFRLFNSPYPAAIPFMEEILKEAPECFKNHYLVRECSIIPSESAHLLLD